MMELLNARFARTIPDVIQRIRVLPRLGWSDYLNLIAVSDVMLDPFHFGGGLTTYDGLAMGVPIVTLPTPFLRGRQALGCYLRMGMDDCVAVTAQQYSEIAVRLGMDRDYRSVICARIAERCDALYDNYETVPALEAFFEEALVSGLDQVR